VNSIKKLHIIFFGLVIAILSVSLLGCSGEKKISSPSKKKEKYVIGFSQIGTESEWRIANTLEMQEVFDKHPRFTLLYSNAEQKRENQITAMRNFITQKVDAIIFVPIVATGWDAIFTEAKDAGIPIVIINRAARMISGNVEDYTVCLVAPDNVYAGELLAKTFADAFENEQGPIYVVEMTGTVGASSAIDRGKGIHNILNNHDRIVIRYSQTSDYVRSIAKQVMESIIKTSQAEGIQLRGIISHNDDMALGASLAIEEAGMNLNDFKIVGIDGIRDAFQAIVDGRYTATIENPVGYGDKTIEILIDLLDNGKKPDDYWVILKTEVFTEKEAAAALPNIRY